MLAAGPQRIMRSYVRYTAFVPHPCLPLTVLKAYIHPVYTPARSILRTLPAGCPKSFENGHLSRAESPETGLHAGGSRSVFRKMTGFQDIYVKRKIRVFWATPMSTSGAGVDLIEVSLERNIVGS